MRFDEEWLEAYRKKMQVRGESLEKAVDVAAVRADLKSLSEEAKAGQKRTKYGNRETRRGGQAV